MNREHEHDWRVDPSILYLTSPPQRRLVCKDCEEEKKEVVKGDHPDPSDPSTWSKAEK